MGKIPASITLTEWVCNPGSGRLTARVTPCIALLGSRLRRRFCADPAGCVSFWRSAVPDLDGVLVVRVSNGAASSNGVSGRELVAPRRAGCHRADELSGRAKVWCSNASTRRGEHDDPIGTAVDDYAATHGAI